MLSVFTNRKSGSNYRFFKMELCFKKESFSQPYRESTSYRLRNRQWQLKLADCSWTKLDKHRSLFGMRGKV